MPCSTTSLIEQPSPSKRRYFIYWRTIWDVETSCCSTKPKSGFCSYTDNLTQDGITFCRYYSLPLSTVTIFHSPEDTLNARNKGKLVLDGYSPTMVITPDRQASFNHFPKYGYKAACACGNTIRLGLKYPQNISKMKKDVGFFITVKIVPDRGFDYFIGIFFSWHGSLWHKMFPWK